MKAVSGAAAQTVEAFDTGFIVNGFVFEVYAAGGAAGCAEAAGNALAFFDINFINGVFGYYAQNSADRADVTAKETSSEPDENSQQS